MPILFGAVASDKNLLVKFASCEGNFTEIANEVLLKISPQNEKVTYFHGPYLFNYIAEDHHLYFCITDKTCQRSRAFLFLNQIKRRFDAEGRAGFTQVLADEMYRYSEDYSTIVIHKGELDELNSIGVRSSEEILGEKSLLVKDIENLNFSTIGYVGDVSEEVNIYNNTIGTILEQQIISNCNVEIISEKTELPVSTFKPEICILNENVLETNQKCKPNLKIVIAIFLLGLAIYIFDFMPFGQVVVLVLFVVFVLMR